MSWYKVPSTYAQKMAKLSCKIFQEYYRPPAPRELVNNKNIAPLQVYNGPHDQNEALILRNSKKPFDLDSTQNYNYYPAHPQIRELMYTLRKHGLFRDEHLDFRDEIARLKILRGKKYRVKGGMTGKRAALRKS